MFLLQISPVYEAKGSLYPHWMNGFKEKSLDWEMSERKPKLFDECMYFLIYPQAT